MIYIGKDFPAEYKGSNYSKNIRGAILKAKANAVQGIAELINIATEKTWVENKKEKHKKMAKNGWYYFKTRFALPVYEGKKKTNYYNIYSARLVVHASSKRLYLYDMVDIKKKRAPHYKTKSQVVKNPFLYDVNISDSKSNVKSISKHISFSLS